MQYETTHVYETKIGITVEVYEAQRLIELIGKIDDPDWPMVKLRETLIEGLALTSKRMDEYAAFLDNLVKGYEE